MGIPFRSGSACVPLESVAGDEAGALVSGKSCLSMAGILLLAIAVALAWICCSGAACAAKLA